MKKTVIFMTRSKYPQGDASSKRNICLARYFVDRNYDVKFVGLGSTPYKKETKVGNYRFVSLRKYNSKNLFLKLINHVFINRKIISFCKKNYPNSNVWLVDPVLYQYVKKDKFFVSKNIIYLAVEFYSSSEYKFNGLFSANYNKNIKFNSDFNQRDGKIISISSYLDNHFKQKGINSIRIPFVTDSLISLSSFDASEIFINNKTFIYCGSPGKKDCLYNMVKGFLLLENEFYKKTKVIVCGVTDKWARKNFTPAEYAKIKTNFLFKGRISYNEIVKNYNFSTFSILLRPFDERYSRAGFPTKISEALEFGLIPVTNFTSDLSIYLKDSINSIEVAGEDELAFSSAIKRALLLSDNEVSLLRKNCKYTSLNKLDIKCFYKELDEFIG